MLPAWIPCWTTRGKWAVHLIYCPWICFEWPLNETHWESGLSNYQFSASGSTYPWPLSLWLDYECEERNHKPTRIPASLGVQSSHLESNGPCWDQRTHGRRWECYHLIFAKGTSCFVCSSWELMKLCPFHNARCESNIHPSCLAWTKPACRLNRGGFTLFSFPLSLSTFVPWVGWLVLPMGPAHVLALIGIQYMGWPLIWVIPSGDDVTTHFLRLSV